MLGAIIGDIVGSVYEHRNIKTKEFPLFRDDCRFTDDTVMTIATADALMNGGEACDFVDAYKKWGRRYPNAGYGGRFRKWLHSDDRAPYNSYGNGSAMRVSPCAWLMDCGFYARTGCYPENGRDAAKRSAAATHNHPEGIKGALAVADMIFLFRYYNSDWFDCEYPDDITPASNDRNKEPKISANMRDAETAHTGGTQGFRQQSRLAQRSARLPIVCCRSNNGMRPGMDEYKQEIRDQIEQVHGYDLGRTIDEIRPTYRFDSSCRGSVPQAITAFLESTDFEDSLRNAISLGGDSDTIAAIAGSIAEAAYGIPKQIKDEALTYLDAPLLEVCHLWRKFCHREF